MKETNLQYVCAECGTNLTQVEQLKKHLDHMMANVVNPPVIYSDDCSAKIRQLVDILNAKDKRLAEARQFNVGFIIIATAGWTMAVIMFFRGAK